MVINENIALIYREISVLLHPQLKAYKNRYEQDGRTSRPRGNNGYVTNYHC